MKLYRTMPVFLVFVALSAVMLLMAYHQLAALRIGAAGFGHVISPAGQAGFGEEGSFEASEDPRQKAEALIGENCLAEETALTKACREAVEQVGKIKGAGPRYTAAVASVMAEQLIFVVLAMISVTVSLLVTILLAVSIDYLAERLGLRLLSDLLNRIIDTIPYTIWLVLAAATFGSIVASYGIKDWEGMSLQTRVAILHGQMVVYLGVSFLLMPLFLNFFLETLRAARRGGLFDMVAMDGLRSLSAYRRVIFKDGRPILYKAVLFGTMFVLLFDPIFERLSGSRALNEAGQLQEGVVPLQVFQSPFYQWALLRFDDPRNVVFGSLGTKAMSHDIEARAREQGGQFTAPLLLAGPTAGNEAHKLSRFFADMRAFPGLMLDGARWNALIADGELCSRSKTCQAVSQSGGIGGDMARYAIRSSYASAYFFANMALLLAMIGALTAWEFWKNYDRRMEQV